jgi:hypothetical protein
MVRALISVRSDEPMSYEGFEISTGNNICELQNSQYVVCFHRQARAQVPLQEELPPRTKRLFLMSLPLSQSSLIRSALGLSRSMLWKLR